MSWRRERPSRCSRRGYTCRPCRRCWQWRKSCRCCRWPARRRIRRGGGQNRHLSRRRHNTGEHAVALHAVKIAVGRVVHPVAYIERGRHRGTEVGRLLGVARGRIDQLKEGGRIRAQIDGIKPIGVVDEQIKESVRVKRAGVVIARRQAGRTRKLNQPPAGRHADERVRRLVVAVDIIVQRVVADGVDVVRRRERSLQNGEAGDKVDVIP